MTIVRARGLRLLIAAIVGVGSAILVGRVFGRHGIGGLVVAFALVILVLQLLNTLWPRQRNG